MERDKQREKKLQKMKKNLKLLMIALIVLAIEKLSEFITALIRGSHPNHAPTLVSHDLVLSDVDRVVFHDIQIL